MRKPGRLGVWATIAVALAFVLGTAGLAVANEPSADDVIVDVVVSEGTKASESPASPATPEPQDEETPPAADESEGETSPQDQPPADEPAPKAGNQPATDQPAGAPAVKAAPAPADTTAEQPTANADPGTLKRLSSTSVEVGFVVQAEGTQSVNYALEVRPNSTSAWEVDRVGSWSSQGVGFAAGQQLLPQEQTGLLPGEYRAQFYVTLPDKTVEFQYSKVVTLPGDDAVDPTEPIDPPIVDPTDPSVDDVVSWPTKCTPPSARVAVNTGVAGSSTLFVRVWTCQSVRVVFESSTGGGTIVEHALPKQRLQFEAPFEPGGVYRVCTYTPSGQNSKLEWGTGKCGEPFPAPPVVDPTDPTTCQETNSCEQPPGKCEKPADKGKGNCKVPPAHAGKGGNTAVVTVPDGNGPAASANPAKFVPAALAATGPVALLMTLITAFLAVVVGVAFIAIRHWRATETF